MDTSYTFTKKEFGLRLAKLREHKNISARQMSLDIGQNKNYINSIESGKNYPSMNNFLDICSYLKITPYEFFQIDQNVPMIYNDLLEVLSHLSSEKYHHLSQIAYDLYKE